MQLKIYRITLKKNQKFKLGERSFRDYKNDAESLIDKNKDINIKQLKVVIGLCKYLGFNSYEDFESRNKSKAKKILVLIKKKCFYFFCNSCNPNSFINNQFNKQTALDGLEKRPLYRSKI